MNRKKIVAFIMVMALALTSLVGGTLAYFTDDDAKANVFTYGNVEIQLNEVFPETELMPGSSKTTALQKEITVENIGESDAYVRIQYAIPSALVAGDSQSYADSLHVNFKLASTEKGLWCWHRDNAEGTYGWTGNGAEVNDIYKCYIDEVEYTVWVVTYRTALAAGEETTVPAITQVYMDSKVSQCKDDTHEGDCLVLADGITHYDGSWEILVVAEGVQSAGFETGAQTDAYDAFDAAFPNPMVDYVVAWPEKELE